MTTLEATRQPQEISTPSKVDAFVRGAGLNILLTIMAGMLASFMLPPREVWWFAWLDLLPLLFALRRTATVRAAGWLMLLFGIVFFFGTLSWMRAIFGSSVIGVYVLAALPWVLFGLAYRAMVGEADGWRSRWLAGVAVVALAPVCWLAVEWIRCEGWYFQFSWAQFGFAFASCRRGGALYPFIGVYGVSFLIMFVNALLLEIIAARTRWTPKLLAVGLTAAIVIPLSLYLNAPIGIRNEPGERTAGFRVGIIQQEVGSLRDLREQTAVLARHHPKLIVWPEYALVDYPLSDPKLLAELQDIARAARCTLVLGCKEHLPDNTRVDWLRRHAMLSLDGALFGNTALIIGPDGTVLGKYHKTHPIQFFSDGVPGRAYPTFPTEVGRLGVAICYDFDFAADALTLVRNGAEVLFVPTFDSYDWTPLQHRQHALMALARAAETGRWVVRATSSGDSQVINPSGFSVATIPTSEGQGSALGQVVAQQTMTPYVRGVYRLPHLCLALALLWAVGFLALAIARRFRHSA
ncbi:MAG TPA: nitrilase-related carbon-nitrogen hydrolase [Armatimonadota bacterium]